MAWVATNALTAYNDSDLEVAGVLYKHGGYFLHDAGNFSLRSLFVGSGAGNLTMSGTGNTAAGAQSLTSNTTGTLNTALGFAALIATELAGATQP